jgi:hypothetical protein
LLFGRFLSFSTNVEFPKNLTEGRFRGYWQRIAKAAAVVILPQFPHSIMQDLRVLLAFCRCRAAPLP